MNYMEYTIINSIFNILINFNKIDDRSNNISVTSPIQGWSPLSLTDHWYTGLMRPLVRYWPETFK